MSIILSAVAISIVGTYWCRSRSRPPIQRFHISEDQYINGLRAGVGHRNLRAVNVL